MPPSLLGKNYGKNALQGLLNHVEVDDAVVLGRDPDLGFPGNVNDEAAEDGAVGECSNTDGTEPDGAFLGQDGLDFGFARLAERTDAGDDFDGIYDVH